MNKKRILWFAAVIAVLTAVCFSCRDIIFYYVSGLEYVRQNYDVTVTKIDVDIDLEIDLSVVMGKDTDGVFDVIADMGDCRLLCYDFGSGKYLYDNHYGIETELGIVEGSNYKLHFADESFGDDPFSFTTLTPVDLHQCYKDLTSYKTVVGDEPVPDVPVSNITVTAGGNTYTPIWYALYPHWQDNKIALRLGLFEDPGTYDELIEQGCTTATVHIDTLYRTEYKIPSIFSIFKKRILPQNIYIEKVPPPFECHFSSKLRGGETDNFTEDPFWITQLNKKEVIWVFYDGIIKNNTDKSEYVIINAEMILESNVPIEWELFVCDRGIDGSEESRELRAQAAANGMFPLVWNKDKSEYLWYELTGYSDDITKLDVAIEEVAVNVKGIRLYMQSGEIFEFYDDNQYQIIEAH